MSTSDTTGQEVELQDLPPTSEESLAVIAIQLTRLNSLLEKLVVTPNSYDPEHGDPELRVPMKVTLDPSTFEKLKILGHGR